MKTNFRFLLALAIGWLTSTGVFAIEPVDGVYQIGSAQDWTEFCSLHNDGSDQYLNAVLTADIIVEGNSMIGINGSGKPYRGVFDGQGHKLTISYDLNEERVAPFRRINGATIKNLIVEGTINTSSKLASGLVGGLWQSGSHIQNCISYVTITDDNSGDATHGGICGSFEDVNGANTIENCAFLGKINAPNREGCGGIVGWTNNNNNNNFIKNCLVDASGFNVKTGSNNDIICRNNGNVDNCYYIGSIDGMKNDKGALAATTEQASSGELCFLLNGSQSATPAWFQTIGTDALPLPLGTAVVYANGALNCDGTPKGDVTFSNTESEPVRDNHTWNEWGFCSACDAMQPDFLTPDAEGFYPVATKMDYNWVMMFVNNGNGHSNIRLTQDLDLSDYAFVPLGVDASKFCGIIDGQGHRIKNMTLDGTKKEQGFISVCAGGTIIRNLIIDSSCQMVGTGGDNVSALVGCVNGNAYGDVITIENVGNEMSFTCTKTNNAGFVARDWSDYLKLVFNNCYNTGNIMGGNENGAFTAWTPRVTLNNCWNTGRIEKTGGYDGSKSLARGNQPAFNNSYDLNSENTDNAGAPTGYEAAWLANGRFCYLLNGNQSTDVAWYQTLGEEGDAYPLPFGTAVVYANGALQCDGVTPKEGSELTFSNTEGSTVDEHQWNDWGFCSVCDAMQPDYMTAVDGVYEIGNEKQLNWFAMFVNNGNVTAKAALIADIDMATVKTYPGIGSTSNRFSGEFDGRGHIIKNLVVNTPDERAAGLIRFASAPVTVKNITMDASSSFKAKNYAAAFIGDLNGTGAVTLAQLGNEAEVTTIDQNGGAIVGCNFSGDAKITLVNSYNVGTITSGWEAGGLSGWLGNDAVTTNCYNMGSVIGERSESFARGNNIQITNCFDPVTNWPALPASPIEDFTNGTIFAALNAYQNCYLWYLSAAEGGHPVLYATEWGTEGPSPFTGVEVAEGDFYLYNVETGYWLMNNNRQTRDWNSHAELDPIGYDFGLTAISGGWQINPYMGNTHTLNAHNLYMDTNDAVTAWTFEPKQANRVSNAYTIKSGDVVLGATNDKFITTGTNNSTWQIVTKEERLAKMQAQYAEASGENPVDLTWLIPGGQFNIADEHAMQLNGASSVTAGAPFVSGQTQGNGVREIWDNTAGFDINYTLTDLPAGIYRFNVSGYYRDGAVEGIGAKHKEGTEVLRAQIYANDKSQPLMSICAPERTASSNGCNKQTGDYFVPDNIGDAAIATRDGLYQNTPLKVVVGADGALTIGIRKEGGVEKDWTIFDAFHLYYFGPDNIGQYISLLQTAIEEAEAFDQSLTTGVLATALNDAIEAAKAKLTSDNSEEIEAAQTALEAALAAAKAVNVTVLKQTIELAQEEGIDVTVASAAIAEATTVSQLDQPLYDLRAARKINALRMPDIYTGSVPAEGKVYIFNLGTGMFLGTGSDWNTHAAVDQVGIEIELVANGDNFKMKTNRGGGWLNWNGYVDCPYDNNDSNANTWHFLPVSGKDNVYNISSNGNDGFLLGYDPNGGTDGKHYWSTIAIDRTGLDNPMNQWKVITAAEREQLIANAAADQPVDVSYLIKNASLNRQDGYDMWSKQCDGGNGGARVSTINDNNGDRAADYAWEYFEPNSFSFMQTVEGLRPGNYEVSVQGFFRNGNGEAQANVVNEGGELVQLASLVANDESVLLPNIASVMSKYPGMTDMRTTDFGEFPNMPQSAIEYFETGYYKVTVPVTVGADGKLTIGVKKDTRELLGDWVVFDNFRLVYKGLEIQTVHILGDFTGGWEFADSQKMTQDSENPAIWTLTVEDFWVKLEEGQTVRKYEYKAAANGAWGIYEVPADGGNQDWIFGTDEYPAGAADSETGVAYDLKFTLNTKTNELTLVPVYDELTTGIVTVNGEGSTVNGSMYNLNGQKVEKARKGLYIIGGKKVVVRK